MLIMVKVKLREHERIFLCCGNSKGTNSIETGAQLFDEALN